MPQRKLSEIDKENIYRAFQERSFISSSLIGRWGIFKNNQMIFLDKISYSTRGSASSARNFYISRIFTQRATTAEGEWIEPHIHIGFSTENLSNDEEGFIPLVVPFEENRWSDVESNDEQLYTPEDIRFCEPELFQRLQQLFQIRQITQEDINNLGRNQ